MRHDAEQRLIGILHDCMTACNQCFDACLEENDLNLMANCIRLDRECAEFCAYFEQAISRGTPFVSELARVCASICETCGIECSKHDHRHCQQCAKSCLVCAEACRKLVS